MLSFGFFFPLVSGGSIKNTFSIVWFGDSERNGCREKLHILAGPVPFSSSFSREMLQVFNHTMILPMELCCKQFCDSITDSDPHYSNIALVH